VESLVRAREQDDKRLILNDKVRGIDPVATFGSRLLDLG
jgi:hypothetical protein